MSKRHVQTARFKYFGLAKRKQNQLKARKLALSVSDARQELVLPDAQISARSWAAGDRVHVTDAGGNFFIITPDGYAYGTGSDGKDYFIAARVRSGGIPKVSGGSDNPSFPYQGFPIATKRITDIYLTDIERTSISALGMIPSYQTYLSHLRTAIDRYEYRLVSTLIDAPFLKEVNGQPYKFGLARSRFIDGGAKFEVTFYVISVYDSYHGGSSTMDSVVLSPTDFDLSLSSFLPFGPIVPPSAGLTRDCHYHVYPPEVSGSPQHVQIDIDLIELPNGSVSLSLDKKHIGTKLLNIATDTISYTGDSYELTVKYKDAAYEATLTMLSGSYVTPGGSSDDLTPGSVSIYQIAEPDESLPDEIQFHLDEDVVLNELLASNEEVGKYIIQENRFEVTMLLTITHESMDRLDLYVGTEKAYTQQIPKVANIHSILSDMALWYNRYQFRAVKDTDGTIQGLGVHRWPWYIDNVSDSENWNYSPDGYSEYVQPLPVGGYGPSLDLDEIPSYSFSTTSAIGLSEYPGIVLITGNSEIGYALYNTQNDEFGVNNIFENKDVAEKLFSIGQIESSDSSIYIMD